MLLYFLIAITATTIGALSGMGGGVIIKPALDALGDFDAATANLLSSVTVFTMALTSVGRQIRQASVIELKTAVPLAVGGLLGGGIGQRILTGAIELFHTNHFLTAVQNICLAFFILIVFIYMCAAKSGNRPSLGLDGIVPVMITGIILGILSSFLGIGGGPINVALIMFICSYGVKKAAAYSIVTILFAQTANLTPMVLTGAVFSHDLSMLPAMIAGAFIGGWAGSKINKNLSEKAIEMAFNGTQILVLIVCLLNIFRSLQ